MADTQKPDLASFTSWKLDILDAVSTDASVSDAEFRVMFRIMQHLNSTSRLAYPAVDRIACQISKSDDRVSVATGNLVKKGWLTKSREHMRAVTEYTVSDTRMNAVLDDLQQRLDGLKEVREIRRKNRVAASDNAKMRDQNKDDTADLPIGDTAVLPVDDNAFPRHKHLQENYLQITPSDSGSEERELPSAYARAKGRDAA